MAEMPRFEGGRELREMQELKAGKCIHFGNKQLTRDEKVIKDPFLRTVRADMHTVMLHARTHLHVNYAACILLHTDVQKCVMSE